MARASLGGVPFDINPESISWDFKMKTRELKTLGGKVVQVYGVEVSDLIVQGSFGRGVQAKGETEGWQARDRMFRQVDKWMTDQTQDRKPRVLNFSFPDRKWSFGVHIKAFSPVGGGAFRHSVEEFNPKWQLTLFVVDENSAQVKKLKDAYLARLTQGVGWKISEYNGPDQEDLEAMLAPYGGSYRAYVEQGLTQMVGGDGSGDGGMFGGQGAFPGMMPPAGGHGSDIVALGHYLEANFPGVKCSEHPQFGGVAPVHVTNSYHYRGEAIDVNADSAPGGEKATLDRVAAYAKAQGFHVIWQATGHYDHVHIDTQGMQ